jgi:hypothetical protein
MVLSFSRPRTDLASRRRTTPETPRHIIQDPLRFHLLDTLPKDNIFDVEYYCVNILTELLPLRSQVDGRRLVIHADNARPHITRKYRAFCEENRLRLAVHSPYSPDLARSDFFLLGHIKHCLQGITFPSCEELLATIREIVRAIPRPTLEDVFRH